MILIIYIFRISVIANALVYCISNVCDGVDFDDGDDDTHDDDDDDDDDDGDDDGDDDEPWFGKEPTETQQ